MRLRFNLSFVRWLAVSLLVAPAAIQTNAEPVLKTSAPRLFTNVIEFRALDLPQAIHGVPVRFEGVVTLIDTNRNLLVLQDASGALALELNLAQTTAHTGDHVRIESSNAVPTVAGFPDFPTKPSGSDWLPSFSAPVNWGNYYLTRMRALVVPPATGNYTFYVASKGSSELWLSTDADPVNLHKIAVVPTGRSTLPEQWNKYPSQASAPIHLQAGQPYLIATIQEQHGGRDDTLSVAWQGPGFELAIIDRKFLVQYSDRRTNGIVREYWNDYFAGAVEPLTSSPIWRAPVIVESPRVTILRHGELPKAMPFDIGTPITPADSFRWVEAEGGVEFANADQDTLKFELNNGKKHVHVEVLGWTNNNITGFETMRVRLRGVCESVFDGKGNETAGIIRVPSPRELVNITSDDAELRELDIVPISDLTPANPNLAWDRQIRIRGTVVRRDTNGYFIQGPGTLTGFISTNGIHWKQVAPPVEIAMSESALAGLAVSSFSPDSLANATFDFVSGPPGSRQNADIANTRPAGKATLSGSTYTVSGGGIGMASTLDQFHYVYQPFNGDGEFVARVTSLERVNTHAVAGVMIRDSLDTKASFANLAISAGGGAIFQFRQKKEERGATINIPDLKAPCWMKLTRRHIGALVRADNNFAAQLGQEVDVVGSLEWENGQPTLLHVHRLEDSALQNTSGNQAPMVSSSSNEPPVVEIARLVPDEGESLRDGSGAVYVRGVVTFNDRAFGTNYLVIQDQTSGVLVRLNSRFVRKPLRVGEMVEFDLRSVNGKWPVPLEPSRIDVLGTAQLPEPLVHPAEFSLPRRGDWQWTEFEGIIRGAKPDGSLVVMRRDGLMPVWVGKATQDQLSRYVDASARLRGVTVRTPDNTRVLLVPSPDFIEISEPAPRDPFVIPTLPIADLSNFNRRSAFHRVEISGIVTYRKDDLLLVQDDSGGIRIRTLDAPSNIRAGDLIEAVGFPDMENSSVALFETLVRKLGTRPLPKPMEPTAAELRDSMHDALLVKLTGQLLDQQTAGDDQVLELQSGERIFRAILSRNSGALESIPAGSQVEVTGVSWTERAGEAAVTAGLKTPLMTFEVLLGSPSSVIVRQRPPWWTWKHTAATIVALIVVLGVALVWIRLLHRQVAQRTRELETAMGKLERETEISATLTERNRLAGELHDGLEQGLSAIMMQLDGLESKLPTNPAEAVRYLKVARNMIRFSRTEVRHSLWDWKSPALANKNLGEALSDIAGRMSAGNHAQVKVQISGSVTPLPPTAEHHLLRIGQEALNNALKYAQANAINLDLHYSETVVRLSVRDDGRGFDPKTVLDANAGHFGLLNLRSRARKMGGRFSVTSTPDHGTLVEVTVPVRGTNGHSKSGNGSSKNEN